VRASDRPAGELRIAYLLNQFPSVTETFILREMAQLERRGVHLLPCALVRPDAGAPIHPEAEPFLPRTVYRPSPGSPQALRDWLATCLRWPKGGVSGTVLALAHSLRRPGYAREMSSALAAACHFAQAFRGQGIQHIHAHFGSRPATVGLILAEITGLSFSLSLHARDVFTKESILLRQKLLESEFATACTQYALDRLLATQPAAVHGRLHLVRHGIDITRLTHEHRPAREPIIAIVGRLVEKKGHRVLLRAAQMLRHRRGNLMVAIAGDGLLRPELESMAESLGIAALVNFCGTLSESQVQELLAAARVLVVPSVVAGDGDRDGLPNVVLEAAAVGTPIVASEISALPEFVVHGETGLLVPPDEPRRLADAIAAVLDDPAAAEARAREARRRVTAQYDVSRNVEALEALFRETIARRLDDRGREQPARPSRRRRSPDPHTNPPNKQG
jgi:glycosyltransferase involved in cell wall biosynthesis